MLLCLSLLTASVASQPDYQLPNLILMAVYVGLTLILAGAAIWSVFITRSALKASSEQSRKVLEASERQSRATIEGVNKQIEESKKQAQEALYNQHKPIIIPVTDPSSHNLMTRNQGNQNYTYGLLNRGSGVAINTFAILAIDGLPDIFCSVSAKSLIQDTVVASTFDFRANDKLIFPYREFEGVDVFPQGVFGYVRLMVTYSDVFDNKYCGVFDYSEELGWIQYNEIKRVEQRLDELVIKRHKVV